MTFTAHRISSDDNVLYPDRISITPNTVVVYKGHVIGYKMDVIQRHQITSVAIRAGLFFAQVLIETSGGKVVVADGFSTSVARKIVSILT